MKLYLAGVSRALEARNMSTRCQIGVYKNSDRDITKPSVVIYRHSDGYPDGAGKDLLDIVKRYKKQRSMNDSEYLAANILGFMKAEQINWANSLEKYKETWEFVGYGICGDKKLHGDIEYFYAVYPDRIETYEQTGIDGKFEDLKKIKSTKL